MSSTYEITPDMISYPRKDTDDLSSLPPPPPPPHTLPPGYSGYDYSNQHIRPSATTTSGGSPTSNAPNAFSFTPTTTATTTTNSSSLSSSRQSWMNGSDIELDEELPPLNIDRSQSSCGGSSAGGLFMSDKEIKTQEVINELIHTEQKHVRNLKILKHHFYLPIKINMYLTKEELGVMFPNLEQVLDLHCNFKKEK